MEISIKATSGKNKKNFPRDVRNLNFLKIFDQMDKNQIIANEIKNMKYYLKYQSIKKKRENNFKFVKIGTFGLFGLTHLYIIKKRLNISTLNNIFTILFPLASGFCTFKISDVFLVRNNSIYLRELFNNKIIIQEMIKIDKKFLD